jgi:hypothetical protein
MIARFKSWGALLATLVLTILAAFLRGRAVGQQTQKDQDNANTLDALERGRDALRDARSRDDAQQLRDNDGQW